MEVRAQPYSVHRNPEAFSGPEIWNPERWEAVHEADRFKSMKRHAFAFGAGPRMCIGLSLAVAEMKMLIARIYNTYDPRLSLEWLLESGKVRPEECCGELWPSKSAPWKKRAALLFRKL